MLAFAWSPDAKKIAFTIPSPQKGSFEAGRQADIDAGIVIDKWSFVVYKLFNNSAFLQLDQRNELWLADVATKKADPLVSDVHVTQFCSGMRKMLVESDADEDDI